MLTAASCFSGIGGAELALPEARWLWSAEVEPFANAVRECHFATPNLGDVLADGFLQRISSFGPLDLLIGGPPCQDFSVAGLRKGIDGARGNLTLRWVQIIHAVRPRYAITENVPGWLSVNNGHAFGAFLAGLVGHDTALLPPKAAGGRWTNAGMVAGPGGRAVWRVLDAQYFGLAQRRQRVFVVFCAGDGPDPAQILLNEPSLRGHPPPRREAGEGTAPTLAAGSGSERKHGWGCGQQEYEADGFLVAPTLPSRTTAGGGLGTDFDCDGGLIAYGGNNTAGSIDVATAVRGHNGSGWHGDFDSETFIAHSLRADWFDASEACSEERSDVADGTGRGTPLVALPLDASNASNDSDGTSHGCGFGADGDPMFTLQAGAQHGIATASLVRRLTPTECERLQGFPDGWTDVPYRGKTAADGPRYRALGNAFAVPVVRWIARRIAREHAQYAVAA